MKRAGRHDDLPALLARQRDQLGPRQERAGAQHHHALAGLEHRPADRFEHRGGRRLDGKIRVLRQLGEGDDRAVDPLLPHPRLGLAAVAHRDAGEGKARQSLREPPGKRPPDGAKAGDGDSFGRQHQGTRSVIPGLAEGESPEPITTTSHDDAKRSCASGIAGVYGFRALHFAEPRNDRRWSKPQPTYFPAPPALGSASAPSGLAPDDCSRRYGSVREALSIAAIRTSRLNGLVM